LLIAALLLVFKSNLNMHRKKWAWAALAVAALYLLVAGFNKNYMDHRISASFSCRKINPAGYFSTPAPFNCMLWYIVAATDSNYYTAYSSVWDDARQPVIFERHPKNYALIDTMSDRPILRNLMSFSDHFTPFRGRAIRFF
jgi:inner membrane protein